jgi:hypothetical protein
MNGLRICDMWNIYIYIYEKYYSAIRRNKIISFAGKWMELEIIMLSEVSQVQKDKSYMFSLICGRQIQKINIYMNTNVIINIYICKTCFQ